MFSFYGIRRVFRVRGFSITIVRRATLFLVLWRRCVPTLVSVLPLAGRATFRVCDGRRTPRCQRLRTLPPRARSTL